MKTQNLIGSFICFLFCLSFGDGACNFPSDLINVWESSSLKQLNFTDTSTVIYTTHYGDVTFNCDSATGSQYILRSSTTVTTLFGTPMEASTCFDLTQITSAVKYIYIHATTQLSQAGNDRMKLKPVGTTLTAADICDESTPYADGTYDMLIKSDSVSQATIRCPDILLATFSYTINSNCYSNSSLDVCSDKSKLQFNYTICSDVVAYSSGGDLSCVYSNVYNSMTYVTLYNNDASTDESSTYRFTCLVLTVNGSVVDATQNPQHCSSSQTSTAISSPGLEITLTPKVTCVSDTTPAASTTAATTSAPSNTDTQVGTASVAAGTTVAILAVIAIIFLLLFFLVFRKGAPYPLKNNRCACQSDRLLYCLSCQCCCRSRGVKVDPEADRTISPEQVGVDTCSDTQVTGNGREVDVLPAPTPPGAKDINELQEISKNDDSPPRRLPPIEQTLEEDQTGQTDTSIDDPATPKEQIEDNNDNAAHEGATETAPEADTPKPTDTATESAATEATS